ncbi:MAG: PaaI family thioesterase [Caldilineaceae bacterium]|nr:PaaI family thioesterase [Caldilineaceae bacterium]
MQLPVAENAVTAAHSNLHTQLAARLQSGLAAHLGIQLLEVRHGYLCAQMEIAPHHMAANGYLHAGSVVTLADTACGFGCFATLPEGANSFTTIELKSNFLRTVTAGTLRAEAQLVHGGRRTQVWDATVVDDQNRALALFRCTQMLLYPDP